MNLFAVVVLLVSLTAVSAIVCLPSFCDGVKQDPLNCAGTVIKGGGFCGCTDVCAKQIGEGCGHMGLTASYGECEKGTTCMPNGATMFGMGVCKAGALKGKRSVNNEQTACEKARMRVLMMMIVYKGQWTPRCETDGSYIPRQCDNQGKCFCVDAEGRVDESSRGAANC